MLNKKYLNQCENPSRCVPEVVQPERYNSVISSRVYELSVIRIDTPKCEDNEPGERESNGCENDFPLKYFVKDAPGLTLMRTSLKAEEDQLQCSVKVSEVFPMPAKSRILSLRIENCLAIIK